MIFFKLFYMILYKLQVEWEIHWIMEIVTTQEAAIFNRQNREQMEKYSHIFTYYRTERFTLSNSPKDMQELYSAVKK